jgi:hypothetical protein
MVHFTRRFCIGSEFGVLGSGAMTALTFVQDFCSPDVMLETGNISVGGSLLDYPGPNAPGLGIDFRLHLYTPVYSHLVCSPHVVFDIGDTLRLHTVIKVYTG